MHRLVMHRRELLLGISAGAAISRPLTVRAGVSAAI